MTPIGHRIFFLLSNGLPPKYSFLDDNKHILTGRLVFHQNRTEFELRLYQLLGLTTMCKLIRLVWGAALML